MGLPVFQGVVRGTTGGGAGPFGATSVTVLDSMGTSRGIIVNVFWDELISGPPNRPRIVKINYAGADYFPADVSRIDYFENPTGSVGLICSNERWLIHDVDRKTVWNASGTLTVTTTAPAATFETCVTVTVYSNLAAKIFDNEASNGFGNQIPATVTPYVVPWPANNANLLNSDQILHTSIGICDLFSNRAGGFPSGAGAAIGGNAGGNTRTDIWNLSGPNTAFNLVTDQLAGTGGSQDAASCVQIWALTGADGVHNPGAADDPIPGGGGIGGPTVTNGSVVGDRVWGTRV